jgi:hypothetical protein
MSNTNINNKQHFDVVLNDKQHWCYYMPVDQDPKEHGGYVPAIVIADQSGYRPLTGQGEGSAPYIWGDSIEDAQNQVEIQNSRIGVNTLEATRIVSSSMFPGARPYKPQS